MAAQKDSKSPAIVQARIETRMERARVFLSAEVPRPPQKPADQIEHLLDFYRLWAEAPSEVETEAWLNKMLDYLELINRMHTLGERTRILGDELEERRRSANLDVFGSE
jgi:hypothetical protein